MCGSVLCTPVITARPFVKEESPLASLVGSVSVRRLRASLVVVSLSFSLLCISLARLDCPTLCIRAAYHVQREKRGRERDEREREGEQRKRGRAEKERERGREERNRRPSRVKHSAYGTSANKLASVLNNKERVASYKASSCLSFPDLPSSVTR